MYHITDTVLSLFTQAGLSMPEFPDHYTHVATIEAQEPEEVYRSMQDRPPQADRVAGRSTSIGDVIVAPGEVAWRVEPSGFSRLDRRIDDNDRLEDPPSPPVGRKDREPSR